MNYNKEHDIVPNDMKFSYLKLTDVDVKQPLSLQTVSTELGISISDLRRLNPIYKLDFIPKSELPAKLTLPIDKALEFIEQETKLYSMHQTKVLYQDIETNMSSTKGKKCIVHIVKAGEFFHKIAMKYTCTGTNIKKWNHLTGDMLHIGQKLKIWVPKSDTNRSSHVGFQVDEKELSTLSN